MNIAKVTFGSSFNNLVVNSVRPSLLRKPIKEKKSEEEKAKRKKDKEKKRKKEKLTLCEQRKNLQFLDHANV